MDWGRFELPGTIHPDAHFVARPNQVAASAGVASRALKNTLRRARRHGAAARPEPFRRREILVEARDDRVGLHEPTVHAREDRGFLTWSLQQDERAMLSPATTARSFPSRRHRARQRSGVFTARLQHHGLGIPTQRAPRGARDERERRPR